MLLTLTESERDLFDKAKGEMSRPDFLMMLLDQHKNQSDAKTNQM